MNKKIQICTEVLSFVMGRVFLEVGNKANDMCSYESIFHPLPPQVLTSEILSATIRHDIFDCGCQIKGNTRNIDGTESDHERQGACRTR